MGKAVDHLVALSEVKGFVRRERGHLVEVGAYDRQVDKAARDLEPGNMIHVNGQLHRVESAAPEAGNNANTVITTTHIVAVNEHGAVVNGPKKKVVDREQKVTVGGHAPKGNHKALKSVWKIFAPRKSKVGAILLRKAIPGHKLHVLSLAATVDQQAATWNSQKPYNEGDNQTVSPAQAKDNAFFNATKKKQPTKVQHNGNDVWLHGSKTGAANVTTTENGVAVHHGSITQSGDKFVAKPNGKPVASKGSVADALQHVMENGQPITEKTYKQMATKPDVTGGNA